MILTDDGQPESAATCDKDPETGLYCLSHSQRDLALAAVLPVVKHMAPLTKSLQVSQPVVGGIMVKVRGCQRDHGCANSDTVAN